MSNFEINITASGVSVRCTKTRRLKDEATGEIIEVPTGSHREAVGLADFAIRDPSKQPFNEESIIGYDTDAFFAKVKSLCESVLGKDMAELTAIAATACAERDAALAQLAELQKA